MSALSYESLKAFLRHEDPEKRLVVTPLLSPQDQVNPRQAAIDVRLGRVFSLVRAWTQGVAELAPIHQVGASLPPLETIVLEYGQPLIIHPHQFVLARTLEIVRVPDTLLSYVIGRSSWGRRGLTVATAVVIHPGFAGPVTLELKNVGEVPIAVYPMDKIAQLTFHEVGTGGGRTAQRSQFAATFVPTLGVVRDPETERRIAFLADARAAQSRAAAGPTQRTRSVPGASEFIPSGHVTSGILSEARINVDAASSRLAATEAEDFLGSVDVPRALAPTDEAAKRDLVATAQSATSLHIRRFLSRLAQQSERIILMSQGAVAPEVRKGLAERLGVPQDSDVIRQLVNELRAWAARDSSVIPGAQLAITDDGLELVRAVPRTVAANPARKSKLVRSPGSDPKSGK